MIRNFRDIFEEIEEQTEFGLFISHRPIINDTDESPTIRKNNKRKSIKKTQSPSLTNVAKSWYVGWDGKTLY